MPVTFCRLDHPASPGDSPVRIPVDVRRFPWVKRLAADYAYDFSSVAPFFSGDPSSTPRGPRRSRARARVRGRTRRSPTSSRRSSGGARRRPGPSRPRGSSPIRAPSRSSPASRPDCSAARCSRCSRRSPRSSSPNRSRATITCRSSPIFWIDAEDHDWDEVRSCTVFDDDLEPRTVSLPPHASDETAPVANVRLDDSVLAALDELETVLPATEFKPALLASLRQAYAPGAGMADAFGRWLEQVLGDRGLVVYDAADPASKPLVAAALLARAVDAGPDGAARGRGRRGPDDARLSLAGAAAGRQPRAVPPRREPPADPPAGRAVRRRRRSVCARTPS